MVLKLRRSSLICEKECSFSFLSGGDRTWTCVGALVCVLGTLMTSNEALIGLADGDVTRARSIARVVFNQRWIKGASLVVKGVPANPRPTNPVDDGVIEAF